MIQSNLSDRFIYVTRGNNCPKCQATKDCRYKKNGLIHCHSHRERKGITQDGYVSRGEDREGFGLWAESRNGQKGSTFVAQMSNVRAHEERMARDKGFVNSQKPLQSHEYWFNQNTFLEQHHADLLLARGLSAADIDSGRFRSTGNSGYEGFSIPCLDIDGLIRGAQVRYDSRDNRYAWLTGHKDKYLYEYYPVKELPSQWVSAGERNELGIIQRDYKAIDELWITEGTLKPYITYCKNKSKNVMVVGFSGGTTNWLSLIRGIEKLPKLKTIVILPDAGAASNEHVAKKVITLGATLNSLVGTKIDIKIADWGQWADKSKKDCDEIENVRGFDVIRRSVKDFKSYTRKIIATERLVAFECALIESHSEKLHFVATKDKAFEYVAISQDDSSWMKQVGDAINSSDNDAVLLAMNTGFGKTHSIEYLVGVAGLNIIYFNASPNNPVTQWIEENGVRFPVKHQGYLPNSNGSKLPSGRPQMVRSDDPRADTECTLRNKAAAIPTNCPAYQSRVASRISTAETESPCNGCPSFGKCDYRNKDIPNFIEKVTAQAKAGKGILIRCHHNSAPKLSSYIKQIPELKDLVFHKVLDDVHPEVDTASVRVSYIKKAIQKMMAMDELACAGIRQFALSLNAMMVKAEHSFYTVEVKPLDIDFDSMEYQLFLQLSSEEFSESRAIEYVGDDYEDYYPEESIGFFKGIPGTEFVNANGRSQFKQYDPDSKAASIAYLEAQKSALANRGDALYAAVAKGEIGKFFFTLIDHPAAHMRIDQKELTFTWLDNRIINSIKAIGHGGKIIKMDATIIDSAFCAAWGFSRSRVTQFLSAPKENSNLSFVDMLDIVKLRKDSPIEIADQLTDFAYYITKIQGANTAFISSREFLGKDNIERLKKSAIKFMSAFGDSVGSNVGQACTDLIIASSFAINIGALQAEYQVIFKALPYYLDGEKQVYTESFNYYSQMKNVAQIKQAVGRIRHNRRESEQVRVYLCDIRGLYGDLFSAYPGCKYETINISDIAQTPKQNQLRKFINAQHYIWSTEGNSDSPIIYKDIATRHFPSDNDDLMARKLRTGLERIVEKKYRTGKYNDYKLPSLAAFKFRAASLIDHAELNIKECWGQDAPLSQSLMVKLRESKVDLHEYCSTLEAGQQYTISPQNDAQMDAAMVAVEEQRIHIKLMNEAVCSFMAAMNNVEPDEPDVGSEHDQHLAALFAPPEF